MQQFLRKYLVLLVALIFVYGAYALTQLSPHTSPHVLGAASHTILFEEPLDGKAPILSSLDSATKEIDVEVYLLSDKDVLAKLLAACGRGVSVKVMLEQHPFGGGNINQKTKDSLSGTCVQTQWTNPAFSLTHEKTIVIDSSEVLILNQNLTTSAFEKNREYDVIDTNQADVAAIKAIFSADWNRENAALADSNLLVSPVSSRKSLQELISGATQSLSIEMEVIGDTQMMNLLAQKARSIPVHLILPTFTQIAANKNDAQTLMQNGVSIKTLSSPYMHAKLIIADNKAYIGSINLSTQSMDENREVGILLTQQDIISQLLSDFAQDWDQAVPVQY